MPLVESKIIFENIKSNELLIDKLESSLDDTQEQITADEIQILRDIKGGCSGKLKKRSRSHLMNLNPKLFKELLMEYAYDPMVLRGTTCIIDSLLQDSKYLSYQDRLKEYLLNLKRIGVETTAVSGYTMTASLLTADSLFVLKVPKPGADLDMTHELFIGLLGTNQLRKEVLNFAYVYGGFMCSGPMINPQSQQVENYCSSDSPEVKYVIYENIAPSISMKQYVKTCTGREFTEKYLQILFALNTANWMIDFTHFDLHVENVLLRKFPGRGKMILKYTTGIGKKSLEEDWYLTTDSVATIIDYGLSHIQYQDSGKLKTSGTIGITGKHFGNSGWRRQFNILSDESFPLHDAFKFLFNAMFHMLYRYTPDGRIEPEPKPNYDAFDEALKLGWYFIDFDSESQDPEDLIRDLAAVYYSMPYSKQLTSQNLEDLIQYVIKVCYCPFLSDTPDGPVMKCGDEIYTCLSEDDFLTRIGLDGRPKPKTALEYYDYMTTQIGDPNYNYVLGLFKQNYREVIRLGYLDLQGFRDELTVSFLGLKVPDVDARILNEKGLLGYQNFVSTVAHIAFTRDRFFTHYSVLEYLINYSGQNPDILRKEFQTFIQEFRVNLKKLFQIVEDRNQKIDQILRSPTALMMVETNPKLRWLLDDRKNFQFPVSEAMTF